MDAAATDGFAVALHLTFLRPGAMLRTYDPSWTRRYDVEGMVARDPTVLWGISGPTGWTRWSDLDPDGTDHVLTAAREAGMVDGITLRVADGDSRSIGVVTHRDPLDEGSARELLTQLERLHHATLAAGGGLAPGAADLLRKAAELVDGSLVLS
ncbi:MAG: autoinducer binding domain-containing protein [Paracoccaceae bacterium]